MRHLLPRRLKLSFLLFSVGSIVSGCFGGAGSPLREELVDQGPVVLDSRNPFVVSHQLLESEKAKSPILKKFIDFRGEPSAIEVKKKWMKPWRIYLFYLDKTEAYLLEESADDWIVRGPERIPSDVLARLQAVPPSSASGLTEEREYSRFDETPGRGGSAVEAGNPEERKPVHSEGSARIEKSSSGDIIHTVSFPGETLRIITAWYTGDVNTTQRLARINGIENPDRLEIGQTVRIPRYLLNNPVALPEGEIERYNRNLELKRKGEKK